MVLLVYSHDLVHVQKRKVDPDEAKAYAEENNIMFMETSAKTAANVNELFVQIGELLLFFVREEKFTFHVAHECVCVLICVYLFENNFSVK
jgi:hypothetical protein